MSEAIGGRSTAIVPNGAALSQGIDLGGLALIGIYLPAALDGASVQFDASEDGATWSPIVKSDGSANYAIPFAASVFNPIPAGDLMGFHWVRIRLAGNQSAQRSFVLILRMI